jgi:flagellar biosynthesis protein FlhA
MLSISIAMSLLILLIILYLQEAADFTGFPTLLLFVTLFRLALNVASTRLILLDGYAGHIIEAFGNFVVRGNYVVGVVVFLILVLINFVVITKWRRPHRRSRCPIHTRRHAGKQMAIDAELSAGVINEARRVRAGVASNKRPIFTARWMALVNSFAVMQSRPC